jgi:hypothetical protein
VRRVKGEVRWYGSVDAGAALRRQAQFGEWEDQIGPLQPESLIQEWFPQAVEGHELNPDERRRLSRSRTFSAYP